MCPRRTKLSLILIASFVGVGCSIGTIHAPKETPVPSADHCPVPCPDDQLWSRAEVDSLGLSSDQLGSASSPSRLFAPVSEEQFGAGTNLLTLVETL